MGKIYLFLTPGKTDGRVHSQQGAPTIGNIIYWEFSQQTYVQTLLASLGVVKLKISLSVRRGGGAGAKFIPSLACVEEGGGRCFRQIAPLDIESPHTPFIIYFPATLSYKDILFFRISQPARICLKNRYFEEHIH